MRLNMVILDEKVRSRSQNYNKKILLTLKWLLLWEKQLSESCIDDFQLKFE
jgi:hypothetical protein